MPWVEYIIIIIIYILGMDWTGGTGELGGIGAGSFASVKIDVGDPLCSDIDNLLTPEAGTCPVRPETI